MLSMWDALVIVVVGSVLIISLAVVNAKEDPAAQQIDACKRSCGMSGMASYDGDKKTCSCAK
jgi:hypothetical protein